MRDFSKEQRQALSNKNTTLADKAKLIESHIFESSGGELNYDDEIREQLRKSHELQEKLKMMQTQTIYDPIKHTEEEQLRKQLNKKLMEFSGTTLI